MGLGGFSYGGWELTMISVKGKNAARRLSMESVRSSFNRRHLKEISKESQFFEVQNAARERLFWLASMSRKQRKEAEREFQKQKEAGEKQAEAFQEAAEDKERPEYWLKKLYEHYIIENSYGREQIEKGLMAYGDAIYPLVRQYVFSIAEQYRDFTARIREIRYGTDEGRQTGAKIDKVSEGLGYAICFLAKFGHPNRVRDIAELYQYIKDNLYSNPESGFSDMFNAVKIRQKTVRAMGAASKNHGETEAFYVSVLHDPSRFVRWEAIDILKDQWTPAEIRASAALYQALQNAYANEDNAVSNRKEKCAYLLGKKY